LSRPFDEARYRALLKGLEVTVIQLSSLKEDNIAFRVDSEFNLKAHLSVIERLRNAGAERFGDSSPSIIHPHEIEREYVEEGGVWFFRAQNLRPLEISETDKVFVSTSDAARLEKNKLHLNDVVLTRTGANAGDCALFDADVYAVASSHTFIIRTRAWSHPYLVAFMNSRYGRCQVLKGRYGAAQPEVAPNYLRSIWIPRFSGDFDSAIERVFENARAQRLSSVTQLSSAEQELLRALGLDDWVPPEPLTYTHPSRRAFSAGRLDAEHFKPKYASLETHIRDSRRCEKLGYLLDLNERGSQPNYADTGLPVINSKHVANGEVSLNDDNRYAIAGDATLTIKLGDVLINGTGVGTIGRAAPFLHESEALPDNHVTVLRPAQGRIDPVYLSVFLNSVAGQYQVNKWLRGSSGQIELYPKDIAEFLVWMAPDEVQQSIRNSIEHAFFAKRNATRLLAAAKHAVEIAIGQSETDAMAYLADVLSVDVSVGAMDPELPAFRSFFERYRPIRIEVPNASNRKKVDPDKTTDPGPRLAPREEEQ
jgi:type I restriction enzyme S subunit